LKRPKLVLAVLLMLSQMVLAACGLTGGQSSAGTTPSAPDDVRVEGARGGLRVTWAAVPGASHYTVFWGTERGRFRYLADSKQNDVLLANVRKGELYSLAVTSWNEHGESSFSDEILYVYDDPGSSRAAVHLAKGKELARQGLFKDALAHLSAAIRLDPNNGEAYRSRARLCERMGKTESARNDYAEAKRLFGRKPISLKR
jgi:hypothetical protein